MLRTRSIYYGVGAALLTLLVALAGCAGDSDKGGRQTAGSAAEKPIMVAREGYQIVEVNGISGFLPVSQLSPPFGVSTLNSLFTIMKLESDKSNTFPLSRLNIFTL